MENLEQNGKKEFDFETKIQEAQKHLDRLMNPKITLSDSVSEYKKGLKEIKDAQELLNNAKAEFEELVT